ncbi:MAG TPA: hypothetical protein VG734_14215 [Lacunisphaera sp.]|nr:hypothetical protein [Lacunisphaera sp.]
MSLLRQAARLSSLFVLALPAVVGLRFLPSAWDMARIHNYRNRANVVAMAVVALCPVVPSVLAEIRPRLFLNWLEAHLDSVKAGNTKYRGARWSPDPELVVCALAFSVLAASFKIPSQILIVGHDRIGFWRVGYTAVSLLFSWWGIPSGRSHTVQAIYSNLRTQQRGRLVDVIGSEGWTAAPGNVGLAAGGG